MSKLISINPASYLEIGSVEISSSEEIKLAVFKANDAKLLWKNTSVDDRVKLLTKARKLFYKNTDSITDSIVNEIGTPYESCRGEVVWDFDYIDWWLNNAQKYLSPETTFENDAEIHQVFREPIGTVAVITPWNLPFDLFVWGVFPNLLAGNPVVYKSAEECCLTGELLSKILLEAGLPDGVFNYINGRSQEGNVLVNENIDAIWLTGSSEVGKKLFEISGKKFIRSSLELGGSNPAIVFDDADIDQAVNKIFGKRTFNSGQTCDAVKRVIVAESISQDFIKKLSAKFTASQSCLLVSQKQVDLAKRQLSESVSKGAQILAQGQPTITNGACVEPVLLGNITQDMPVWREEVFAPILPIVTFKTEEEAVTLANDTEYGLGALVFSQDIALANRVASQLNAGAIDINKGGHWRPENPFGGYKNSGIGREHGRYGFEDITQVKVISQNK